MVEARGVEPLSENSSPAFSPSAADDLISLSQPPTGKVLGQVAS